VPLSLPARISRGKGGSLPDGDGVLASRGAKDASIADKLIAPDPRIVDLMLPSSARAPPRARSSSPSSSWSPASPASPAAAYLSLASALTNDVNAYV